MTVGVYWMYVVLDAVSYYSCRSASLWIVSRSELISRIEEMLKF